MINNCRFFHIHKLFLAFKTCENKTFLPRGFTDKGGSHDLPIKLQNDAASVAQCFFSFCLLDLKVMTHNENRKICK